MGDLIQMIPLLSRLEEEWPGVGIDLIVDKEFAHVASLIPGIRQVLMFDFQLLMDESRVRARDVVALYQNLAHWVQPLFQIEYDRVVNLTFNRRSAFLVKCFGCSDERGMTTAQDGSVMVKNPWMKYFVDFHVYRQLNRFNIVDLFALGGSGP
jgi:ADP-heptose:LPS heptosyltransferase